MEVRRARFMKAGCMFLLGGLHDGGQKEDKKIGPGSRR